MIESVKLLLPAELGQLHKHAIVEYEIPASLGYALIGFDARRDCPVLGNGVDDVGRIRAAFSEQQRQPAEFLRRLCRDDVATALDDK